MIDISLNDQIACVEREIKMRRRVYSYRVFKGLMARDEMEREIACMEAVLETLAKASSNDFQLG